MRLGSNTFIDTPRIVVIDELDIIGASYDAGHPLLNVVMIDEYNNGIGIVDENEWVFDRRAVWDIDYRLRKLTIRSKPRKIVFEMAIGDAIIQRRTLLQWTAHLDIRGRSEIRRAKSAINEKYDRQKLRHRC